tara:strand:+ start:1229 stop:2380 length:1152 start_codon:yes stop_codon:yes gene_type:complete
MDTLSNKETDSNAGKRFRLTVKSAEEAVRIIREKLGDNARVLSVRQIGGEGLKRFISSPKLEVIAEIPSENDESELPETELIENSKLPTTSSPENSVIPSNQETQENTNSVEPNQLSENESFDSHQTDSIKILTKAGFDEQLIRDIEAWSNWREFKDMSLADTLKEITVGLTDRYKSLENKSVGDKIALIGAPGVGKTTTLCKFLAHDVFMNKKSPNVLKVENGVPNPDDALRIFCEVVGVTLFREAEKVPDASFDNPLYLDFPGLSLGQLDDWIETSKTLDALEVQTRVLVLNSAYDKQVLNKSLNLASRVGATHLAFTHFDELTNSTKLWPMILRNNFTPLCVCNGQNVTGDFSTNVLNQMIARTFPEELYARGFSSYRKV